MNNLYVMVGISGSGKSTYAKEHLQNAIYISRDEFRYKYLKTEDDYFKYEGQVFRDYTAAIANALNAGRDVVADATHLNKPSRRKLLNAVLPKLNHRPFITAVVMGTPHYMAQERNNLRDGIEKVPAEAIYNQMQAYCAPTKEKEPYLDAVQYVLEDGEIYNA